MLSPDVTRKERPSTPRSSRPYVATARQAWRDIQPKLDPSKLIFIDESGVATNMARRYGRAPRRTSRLQHAARALDDIHLHRQPAL